MAEVAAAYASVALREIERLKALYPEIVDDADLLIDTVQGSTSFDNALDRLTVAFMGAVALKEANASVQSSLKERGERFDRRADAMKALIFALMQSAGMRKAELPSATVSIAKGRDTLLLDDDFNAQGYMRVKVEPMKADILAALKAGNPIPGARLEPAPDHLTIRTK